MKGHSAHGVLVTGAGTGLGREIALRLAALGLPVYGSVFSAAEAAALEQAAAGQRLTLRAIVADIRDRSALDRVVSSVVGETGGIAAVVNSAGTRLRGCFEDLGDDEIRALFETNVYGSMTVARSVLPHMRAARRGRIVFITSIAGRIGSFGISAYSASKFAQEGFGESLAQEVAPCGIDVVLVEPAIIRTEAWGVNRVVGAGALHPGSVYTDWFRRSEMLADRMVRTSPTTAADVASRIASIVTTAKRPRLRYVVGRRARVVLALRRQLPGSWFERLYFGSLVRMITRGPAARRAGVDAGSGPLNTRRVS